MSLKSGVLSVALGLVFLSVPAPVLRAESSGSGGVEYSGGRQKSVSRRNRREAVRDNAVKPAARPAIQQKASGSKGSASSLPAGVKSEEVKFAGNGVQLAGTLLLPKMEAGRRAPAVVIYGDARPATRDGVPVGGGVHYLYRDLAEHLAAKGIAVLRYDRRCAGASDCKRPSNFDDYIMDGEAVVKYVRRRADIDPQRVVLFGHGEGGLLAGVVASHDEGGKDKLAGVVLAATAGRFGSRVVREQIRVMMTAQGKSAGEIETYLQKVDQIVSKINAGESNFSAWNLDPGSETDAMLIRLTENPAFAFVLLTTDPLQTVKTIRVPVLILQGEKDVFVTVSDAEYLDEAFAREGHKDCTMKTMPDADHVFKVCKGDGSLKTYQDTARPLDQASLNVLTEWLQKKLTLQ
ncbi:MAG TPA: alpha/beta fold hydrolase [Blastocatellia bacterium]|nr:alpha/beta fold hydrolase [Blastocatellia bacterium]